MWLDSSCRAPAPVETDNGVEGVSLRKGPKGWQNSETVELFDFTSIASAHCSLCFTLGRALAIQRAFIRMENKASLLALNRTHYPRTGWSSDLSAAVTCWNERNRANERCLTVDTLTLAGKWNALWHFFSSVEIAFSCLYFVSMLFVCVSVPVCMGVKQ